MRQAIILALTLWAAFYVIVEVLDFGLAVAIAFSATMLIAAMNALTFLWLWYVRATPLALGMALNWSGQAALSAWWYRAEMSGTHLWLNQDPIIFLFLSIYMVGGGIHVAVIQNSLGTARTALLWPLIAVVAIAAGMLLGG